MKGNQLLLKLVHFTEKLLNAYLNLALNGRMQIPEVGRQTGFARPQNPYLLTEDSQRNKLREAFSKLSTAKLAVEGLVVPNIVLT